MSLLIARSLAASMRAQIAALDIQMTALESALGMEQPAVCPHPVDEREPGNFGEPERCSRCGASV